MGVNGVPRPARQPAGVLSDSDEEGGTECRVENLTVGAATDDTITHAPFLKSVLAYQWLYHNAPHFDYTST